MNRCRDCVYCFDDRRGTVYRREHCWFGRGKGPHLGRQFRGGEGNRIDPDAPGCPDFREKENLSENP